MAARGTTAEYHLHELAVARDPTAPGHLLPPIGPTDRAILDLGCGAGQSLVAAVPDDGRLAVGLDVDEEALSLGRTLTDAVRFVAGRGETLPFAGDTFDLVISRVALPYTDIPRTLGEVARVLKAGGRCWLTLHPPAFAWRELAGAIKRGSVRSALYQLYVLANGLSLELAGRQFAYPLRRARFESVQTERGMRRALYRAGFVDVGVERGRFFVVTGARRS